MNGKTAAVSNDQGKMLKVKGNWARWPGNDQPMPGFGHRGPVAGLPDGINGGQDNGIMVPLIG